ncbi:MAG: hypothetical protein QOF35_154 [Actinomycetota bacterium]|jgi:hypothetical protein|nr:hypothetical protein [Actinomycetota bacterium]
MSSPLLGYQYVVLRCVPRVDREEFINVGVVLHSQGADFLDCAFNVDPDRLRSFSPDLDLDSLNATLQTVCAICHGEQAPGRPRLEGLGQRFGWFVAPRSTVIQPGPVHGGLTHNPAEELARLLARLVA